MPLPLLLEVVSSLPSSSGTMESSTCWMALRGKMHFGDGLNGRFDGMDFLLDGLMRMMLLLQLQTILRKNLAAVVVVVGSR